MGKVRLGVIGCGLASDILYGPAFQYLQNGEIIAVMDTDGERVREIQERYGAEHGYTNLADICNDKNVDAVMVLTPPHHHRTPVIEAAKAGKHVFCEKPMAPTIEEADEMVSACADSGVKLMMAFMKRFNRSFQQVKELIDTGRLGQVFEVRARLDEAKVEGPREEEFRMTLESGGGVLQENGSHLIDVLRWWLGDVCEVSAQVMIVAKGRRPTEDVGSVTMKHKNGAMSTLHITMLTHARGGENYEVFGTQGTLMMQWLFHPTPTLEAGVTELYENSTTVTDLTLTGPWHPVQKIQKDWQYLRELEHFCESIIKDEEPHSNGADGRAVVEIINAAYLSSWSGTKVKLPLTESPDVRRSLRELGDSSPWSLGRKMWRSRYSSRS